MTSCKEIIGYVNTLEKKKEEFFKHVTAYKYF